MSCQASLNKQLMRQTLRKCNLTDWGLQFGSMVQLALLQVVHILHACRCCALPCPSSRTLQATLLALLGQAPAGTLLGCSCMRLQQQCIHGRHVRRFLSKFCTTPAAGAGHSFKMPVRHPRPSAAAEAAAAAAAEAAAASKAAGDAAASRGSSGGGSSFASFSSRGGAGTFSTSGGGVGEPWRCGKSRSSIASELWNETWNEQSTRSAPMSTNIRCIDLHRDTNLPTLKQVTRRNNADHLLVLVLEAGARALLLLGQSSRRQNC